MVCTTLCSIRTTSYKPLSSRNTIHRDDRIHAYLTPTSKETLVKTLPLARSKRQSSVLLKNKASTTTTNASFCIYTGRLFSCVLGFLLVSLLPCCASHNASSAVVTSSHCIISQLPPHCRYDTWSRIQLILLSYCIYYMTVCGRDNAWTPSQGFGQL